MVLITAVVVGAIVVVDNEETNVDSIGMDVVGGEELLVVEVVDVEVVGNGSLDHMISSTCKSNSPPYHLPMT